MKCFCFDKRMHKKRNTEYEIDTSKRAKRMFMWASDIKINDHKEA